LAVVATFAERQNGQIGCCDVGDVATFGGVIEVLRGSVLVGTRVQQDTPW
jgi:hypothetical protein